jgi:hypothetical protein
MKQFPSRPSSGVLASYGLIGSASLALDLTLTRLRFPECRLMRPPFYVRGKRCTLVVKDSDRLAMFAMIVPNYELTLPEVAIW